ncbi:MAG: methylmalonyl Co-A mutase-associated GTPase MeaB [Chitinophagaceae bacterium]|nr:MAG: methylmalonyl Co-A mutase-associated GTPase MeaB [Chitinophagaceae bacterium]
MTDQLIQKVYSGDIRSLAKAISLVENYDDEGLELLLKLDIPKNNPVIGITGPPGAGKSTFVNELVKQILSDTDKKIAVIAVDPSSPFNKGALLGDRVRMSEHFLDERVYIRSLASRGSLGGLSDKIIEVTDLCRAAGFDYIFIETVGVGQSEVEIAGLADITIVLLVPESGDEVQAMKAGLMEIADIFVVNKADRANAENFYLNLIKLVKSKKNEKNQTIPVLKTVAQTGKGIDEVVLELNAMQKKIPNKKERFLLMALKAKTLIQNCRTKDLEGLNLPKLIQKEEENGNFQLYRFVKKYC